MSVTTTDPGFAPASEVMGVKLSDLKAMVDAARAIGAKRIRIGECEVELAAPADEPKPPDMNERQLADLAKELAGDMPDAVDLLMWSAPGPLPSEESQA